jgi:NAD(P)-dependent dehydrogenase (short-subunit alcohol dehydrogenase family)
VNDISANQAGIDKLVSNLNSQHGDNTAIGVVADVTSSAEVKKMVDQTVEKLGPLTVMVANAGIAQVTPVLEISDEDVQKMFNVNFIGVWNWFVTRPAQHHSQRGCFPASQLHTKILSLRPKNTDH